MAKEKTYLCKKTDKVFQKGWVYDFDEQTTKKKGKYFESHNSYLEGDKREYYQYTQKKFKNYFTEYKNQPLKMTGETARTNPLGKANTNIKFAALGLLLLTAIIGFMFHLFSVVDSDFVYDFIPIGRITSIISVILLIVLMEGFYVWKIFEAKKNNIVKISFGATVTLKGFSFLESLITLVGTYYLTWVLWKMGKALFENLEEFFMAIGTITLVVGGLWAFFYLNYKVQQKILNK